MHAVRLLQKIIEKSCPTVHKKRSNCLFDVVEALIHGGQLWVTGLGRALRNQTTAKHNIKKADSLVGNKKLHQERLVYYKHMAHTMIVTK